MARLRSDKSKMRFTSGSSVAGMLLVFLSILSLASARDILYCSSMNTGSDADVLVDIFNSHGLCYDFCMSRGKAFAIVQFTGCWCSDLAPDPSKSADKKECGKGCPGYDKETCGSLEKDLYSYMRLPNIVKGTVGVTSTRTTASKTVGKPTPATESKTVIVPTTIVSIVTQTQTPTDAGSSAAPTDSSSTGNPNETITLTAVPSGSLSEGDDEPKSFWQSTGKVVGLFIGIALFIGLVILAGIYLYWRRTRSRVGMHHLESDSPTPPILAEKRGSRIVGYAERGSSSSGIVGAPTRSGSGGREVEEGPRTLVVDQRLDPALWQRLTADDVESRMSIRSLQDNEDYSRRVLKVANPVEHEDD